MRQVNRNANEMRFSGNMLFNYGKVGYIVEMI